MNAAAAVKEPIITAAPEPAAAEAAANTAAAAPAFIPRASRPHIIGVYGAAWAQQRPVAARPRPVNPWLGL